MTTPQATPPITIDRLLCMLQKIRTDIHITRIHTSHSMYCMEMVPRTEADYRGPILRKDIRFSEISTFLGFIEAGAYGPEFWETLTDAHAF